MMSTNFGVMESLGDEVSRPFLQDVVTFGGLGKTLLTMAAKAPLFVPQILTQAGPGPIADWAKHFAALGAYDALSRAAEGFLKPVAQTLAGVAPSGELVAGDDEASAAARDGRHDTYDKTLMKAAKVRTTHTKLYTRTL